jgi:hypothetical protein
VLLLVAGEEHLALDRSQVVQEENAIEVVDLVLDGPRCQAIAFPGVALSIETGGLDLDPG